MNGGIPVYYDLDLILVSTGRYLKAVSLKKPKQLLSILPKIQPEKSGKRDWICCMN
jgi:hypothetical protein